MLCANKRCLVLPSRRYTAIFNVICFDMATQHQPPAKMCLINKHFKCLDWEIKAIKQLCVEQQL